MIRLKIKNYNMILKEKLLKYQPCHQAKYYHQIMEQIIEQATFTYYPLGIAFEKQKKAIEDQGETGSGFERFKTKRTNKINRKNFSRRL